MSRAYLNEKEGRELFCFLNDKDVTDAQRKQIDESLDNLPYEVVKLYMEKDISADKMRIYKQLALSGFDIFKIQDIIDEKMSYEALKDFKYFAKYISRYRLDWNAFKTILSCTRIDDDYIRNNRMADVIVKYLNKISLADPIHVSERTSDIIRKAISDKLPFEKVEFLIKCSGDAFVSQLEAMYKAFNVGISLEEIEILYTDHRKKLSTSSPMLQKSFDEKIEELIAEKALKNKILIHEEYDEER